MDLPYLERFLIKNGMGIGGVRVGVVEDFMGVFKGVWGI